MNEIAVYKVNDGKIFLKSISSSPKEKYLLVNLEDNSNE